jgi:hypothetical protein
MKVKLLGYAALGRMLKLCNVLPCFLRPRFLGFDEREGRYNEKFH